MAADAEDSDNEEVRETERFISDEEVTLFDMSSRNRCPLTAGGTSQHGFLKGYCRRSMDAPYRWRKHGTVDVFEGIELIVSKNRRHAGAFD